MSAIQRRKAAYSQRAHRARRHLASAGVVVFGLTPNTDFVRGQVATDERGIILTNEALRTNVPGIFVAGDCGAGSTRQAAAAAGEGTVAAQRAALPGAADQ